MGTLTELVDIIEQRMRNAKANIERHGKDSNVGRLFTPKYELLESIIEEWEGKPFNASESNCTIHGVMPVFYSPDKKPRVSEDDPSFSVDVFIMDENGVHGLACWSYEDDYQHWIFHTDTMVDYFEKGNEIKWKWYYPPYTQKQIMS